MSHAMLSPSGAHRWLVCTPSARLEEGFADTSSESALEGTLAHALAELKITQSLLTPLKKSIYSKKIKEFQADERYTKEMDRLTDDYLEYIRGIVLTMPDPPLIEVERRLDLTAFVPDAFGTADCLIIYGDTLHIVDLKYGKNKAVSPEDNPQLKLYALGALQAYALFFNINSVHLHIFQPRNAEGGGEWVIEAKELEAWGAAIKPIVEKAYAGEGDQIPGAHCQFCKAKAVCRTYADQSLALCRHEFKQPPLLSHEEVGDILKQARDLASWAKALEEWALSEVLAGNEVPGWKAVEGRRDRAWTNQEEAFQALIASGVDETILYERKPLTLSKIESELGKKEFNNLVGEYVTKKDGKPTLVLESDKREPIQLNASAEEDFKS